MVAVEDLSSDTSDEKQKNDKEFNYKGKKNLFLKGLNVIIRSQSRQNLGLLNTNMNL